MEDYPRTLAEFETRFPTDAACRGYLFALRWPEGFRCPRCGHAKAWPVARVRYQCASCAHQASVIGWDGYSGLRKKGYRHKVTPVKGRKASKALPLVHKAASLLKRWLMGTHQGAVSREHLDYYLDEFTFRFNRRTSRYRGKLFHRLLQNAVAVGPAPFQTLTRGSRGRKKRRTPKG